MSEKKKNREPKIIMDICERIKITDKGGNFTVMVSAVRDEEGNIIEKASEYYYNALYQAINCALRLKVDHSRPDTPEEYLERLKSFRDGINEVSNSIETKYKIVRCAT